MTSSGTNRGDRKRDSRATAVSCLMLLLWLATYALAEVPALHHLLHQDSDSPAHQCLVTHLHEESPAPGGSAFVSIPARPSGPILRAAEPDLHFLHHFDYRLSPGRAPPVSSSSLIAVEG